MKMRNPYALLARQRRSGAHQRSRSGCRQQHRQQLEQEVDRYFQTSELPTEQENAGDSAGEETRTG